MCTGKPIHVTCFIVIFALLQWSGTKPVISPRSVCNFFSFVSPVGPSSLNCRASWGSAKMDRSRWQSSFPVGCVIRAIYHFLSIGLRNALLSICQISLSHCGLSKVRAMFLSPCVFSRLNGIGHFKCRETPYGH